MTIRLLMQIAITIPVGGCGASTGVGIEFDANADVASDHASPCEAIFSDCDGSILDCRSAFFRGCECGAPPGHLVAGIEITRTMANRPRWIDGVFVVQIGPQGTEGRRAWLEVYDALGARNLRRIEGYLETWVGSTVYVRGYDESGGWADVVRAVDVHSGRVTAELEIRRQERGDRVSDIVALDNGGLVRRRLPGSPTVVDRLNLGYIPPSEERVVWETEITISPLATADGHISGWDGQRMLAAYGFDLVLYNPLENAVIGPIRHPDITGTLTGIVPTRSGWLMVRYINDDGPWRNTEFLAIALTPHGELRAPAVRWRDPGIAATPGEWFASNGDQYMLLYQRLLSSNCPPDCTTDLVMREIDEDGVVQRDERLIALEPSYGRVRSFEWAGYSYAYSNEVFEGPDWTGVELRRVCP